MENERIDLKFNANLNKKLHCDIFTTIRIFDEDPLKVSDRCFVIEKNQGMELFHGVAEVLDVEQVYANELDNRTCFMDSGMNKSDLLKYLEVCHPNRQISKTPLYIVTLRYEDECEFCSNYPAEYTIGRLKVCSSCMDEYQHGAGLADVA